MGNVAVSSLFECALARHNLNDIPIFLLSVSVSLCVFMFAGGCLDRSDISAWGNGTGVGQWNGHVMRAVSWAHGLNVGIGGSGRI